MEKHLDKPVQVRWCVNNYMRHRPDETVLRWKQTGAHVEIAGCLGYCQQCRGDAYCLVNEELFDNLSTAERLVQGSLVR